MCTRIINLTPHPINIIDPSDCHFNAAIRKMVANANVTPIAQIPSYGVVNAKMSNEQGTPINGIPVMKKEIIDVEPLPEFEGDCIYVVSALYATAFKRINSKSDARLYTVADPVYTEDGRTILGSRGICEVF